MKTNIIALLVFVSILFSASSAFALLDCRVATFQRNVANQDYQDALTAAEDYAGGDFTECADLWNDYYVACEDYGQALMTFWHSCIEHSIVNPVLKEAREEAFEGSVLQMINECSEDYTAALVDECL